MAKRKHKANNSDKIVIMGLTVLLIVVVFMGLYILLQNVETDKDLAGEAIGTVFGDLINDFGAISGPSDSAGIRKAGIDMLFLLEEKMSDADTVELVKHFTDPNANLDIVDGLLAYAESQADTSETTVGVGFDGMRQTIAELQIIDADIAPIQAEIDRIVAYDGLDWGETGAGLRKDQCNAKRAIVNGMDETSPGWADAVEDRNWHCRNLHRAALLNGDEERLPGHVGYLEQLQTLQNERNVNVRDFKAALTAVNTQVADKKFQLESEEPQDPMGGEPFDMHPEKHVEIDTPFGTASSFVPPDWKHVEAEGVYSGKATAYVPPNWKHVEVGSSYGFDTPTYYVPYDFKHLSRVNYFYNKISAYVPPEWNHVELGSGKSLYRPPDWKHVEAAGYVGGLKPSSYVEPNWKHSETQGGLVHTPSSYDPPDWRHVEVQSGGHPPSSNVHPSWEHIEIQIDEYQPTAYAPPGKKHVRVESQRRQPSYYVDSDWKHIEVKSQGYAPSSYVPGYWKHVEIYGSEYQNQQPSSYVPSTWKHADKESPYVTATSLVSPRWVHSAEANEYYPASAHIPPNTGYHVKEFSENHNQLPSTLVPTDWHHSLGRSGPNQLKSALLPPNWRHIAYSTDSFSSSTYVPELNRPWVHIIEGNFRSSYRIPNEFSKHISEGRFQSKYVPMDYIHANQDGPDKSNYVPPQYTHLTEGDLASYYAPQSAVHLKDEVTGVVSQYAMPGDVHRTEEPLTTVYLPPIPREGIT